MTNNSWLGVVIAILAIIVLASSPTIMGIVFGIGTILVPIVLIIAGLIFMMCMYRPPVWVLALYGLCWFLFPGIAFGLTLLVGLLGGLSLLLRSHDEQE